MMMSVWLVISTHETEKRRPKVEVAPSMRPLLPTATLSAKRDIDGPDDLKKLLSPSREFLLDQRVT